LYGPGLFDIVKVEETENFILSDQFLFERAKPFTTIKILGPNRVIQLSIPVKKYEKGCLLSDIKIDYLQKWQNQHWRSLQSCYGRSPFFEYFKNDLEDLFYRNPEFLIEFTVPLFIWVLKQYLPKKDISVNLAQKTDVLQPINGLPLSYSWNKTDEKDSLQYTQVFGKEFVPNLSVWDSLFCAGPNFGICKTV
jgi:hypothetical protein